MHFLRFPHVFYHAASTNFALVRINLIFLRVLGMAGARKKYYHERKFSEEIL